MDQCAKEAQTAFPDHTAEANAKRDAKLKECLAAKKLRFYCNRPWQSAVVRRVLHGPITAACPASFLRTHGDAEIVVADYVAAKPDIRLR